MDRLGQFFQYLGTEEGHSWIIAIWFAVWWWQVYELWRWVRPHQNRIDALQSQVSTIERERNELEHRVIQLEEAMKELRKKQGIE